MQITNFSINYSTVRQRDTARDIHQPLKSHFRRGAGKAQQLLWLILVLSDMLSSVSRKIQKLQIFRLL